MFDNSILLQDASTPAVTFKPRLKDRSSSLGAGVMEAVHGVSDAAGNQINPATSEGQAAASTALGSILTKLGTKLSVQIDGDSVQLTLPPGLAQDATLAQAVSALISLHADVGANHADLVALHADAGTTLHADLAAILARLGQALSVTTTNPPTGYALDATLQAVLTALGTLATHADEGAELAKLEALRLLLAGTLAVSGSVNVGNLPATQAVSATALPLPAGAATDAKLEAVRALLAAALTVQGSVTANLGTLNGVALDSSLQSILTVLQAQRAETLWTDDTGAFFVRIDVRGTVTWTDPTGNASSGPGTGARPAAGASMLVDSTRYQAAAAAAGYAIGDYLSHVVTIDPKAGVSVGDFWINATQAAKLASPPAAANITPIAPRPSGVALDASVLAGNTTLASILGVLGTLATDADLQANTAKAEAIRALLAGTLNVAAAALPLPAGASTSAKQDTGNASLAGILTALAGVLSVSGTAAVGAAPVNPPLSISGVDGAGLKRHLLTDTAGAQVVVEQPYRPLPGTTVSVTAGPTATAAGSLPLAAAGAIPAGTATSYRVRNAAASASPVTWVLTTDATKTPVIPAPAGQTGAGGTPGDKSIDPGGVEVISLSPAQQAALAAGTLYLSAVTPAGGSAVLSITPGVGG